MYHFSEKYGYSNGKMYIALVDEKLAGCVALTKNDDDYCEITFVIGGTSAEKNLLTVKLASTHYYDSLPTTGNEFGRAFRDIELEKQVLEEAHRIGLGAQFGGKYLAHDVRIIRLPRHGASCPVGLGVSCSADRNIKCCRFWNPDCR